MSDHEEEVTMKRFHVIIALLCLAGIAISFGFAQENVSDTEPVAASPTPAQSPSTEPGTAASQDDTITELDLFTWANTTPPDWGRGILFAFLGFIGALVAIFALIGGVVPGTAGQAMIEADTIRLKNETDRLDELIKAEKCEPECIKAVASAVNDFRDDLNAERRHQFTLAASIYIILGAFFASMLALNMLQAILVGFGWTGVIGSLGLKSDYQYRKSVKDDELGRLHDEVEEWEQRPGSQESTLEVGRKTGEGSEKAAQKKSMNELNYTIARKI